MKNNVKNRGIAPIIMGIIIAVVLGAGAVISYYAAPDEASSPLQQNTVNQQQNIHQTNQTQTNQTNTQTQTQTQNNIQDNDAVNNVVNQVTSSAGLTLSTEQTNKVEWRPGTQQTIKWNALLTTSPQVNITAMVDNQCPPQRACPTPPENFIIRETENDGEYQWIVGDWTLANSGVRGIMPTLQFILRVRDAQFNNILGQGIVQIISPAHTNSYLTILSPNGGERWQTGQTVSIIWTTWPFKEIPRVDIKLISRAICPPGAEPQEGEFYPQGGCSGEDLAYVLVRGLPNSGKFDWSVGRDADGKDIKTGNYRIQVTGAGNTGGVDESDRTLTLSSS